MTTFGGANRSLSTGFTRGYFHSAPPGQGTSGWGCMM